MIGGPIFGCLCRYSGIRHGLNVVYASTILACVTTYASTVWVFLHHKQTRNLYRTYWCFVFLEFPASSCMDNKDIKLCCQSWLNPDKNERMPSAEWVSHLVRIESQVTSLAISGVGFIFTPVLTTISTLLHSEESTLLAAAMIQVIAIAIANRELSFTLVGKETSLTKDYRHRRRKQTAQNQNRDRQKVRTARQKMAWRQSSEWPSTPEWYASTCRRTPSSVPWL